MRTAPPELLGLLLDSIADAVYVVDHEGRVEFANPAALELLGWPGEELIGRPSHATIHHHHWDGTPFPEQECLLLRPRTTGETVRAEDDVFWRRDGSRFRVSYSSAPLATAGGRGAVVVFRDVTALLEAEEALRREAVARARAEELHASRARIVEAADAERRRLVRDLHDGAQQRLIGILLALRRAADNSRDAAAAELIEAAARETQAAIGELRDLGSGLHPQILTNRGVAAAVESLTGPLPLVVSLEIPERRWPAAVEAGGVLHDRRGADERRQARAGRARDGARHRRWRRAGRHRRRRRPRRRDAGARPRPRGAAGSGGGARRAARRGGGLRGRRARRRHRPRSPPPAHGRSSASTACTRR